MKRSALARREVMTGTCSSFVPSGDFARNARESAWYDDVRGMGPPPRAQFGTTPCPPSPRAQAERRARFHKNEMPTLAQGQPTRMVNRLLVSDGDFVLRRLLDQHLEAASLAHQLVADVPVDELARLLELGVSDLDQYLRQGRGRQIATPLRARLLDRRRRRCGREPLMRAAALRLRAVEAALEHFVLARAQAARAPRGDNLPTLGGRTVFCHARGFARPGAAAEMGTVQRLRHYRPKGPLLFPGNDPDGRLTAPRATDVARASREQGHLMNAPNATTLLPTLCFCADHSAHWRSSICESCRPPRRHYSDGVTGAREPGQPKGNDALHMTPARLPRASVRQRGSRIPICP